VTAGVLREAAADGHPVWIGYADDAGGVRPLLVRPLRVEGGRLRATVAEQDAARTFLLHRISGARPAE
ncbi:WYL domain-containing protein, partial [Ornithinicoccus halotolerans]|uniref:WYL domain-containing protein n=1 Tax=Ornithinicoccus halotolerans TaxID=1748220 RepID=UPI001885B106